ncbi:hypothetical protein V8J82_01390 [Gymnodinialimonas sp. 2305UL16-5]|uniref:hypothetical protein n=1 Tax=Gymnodinialimonas mytili TaxID=3126503 RepID=UPI0030A0F362
MSAPDADDAPFFIGWARPDRRLWGFLVLTAVVFFVGAFGTSYLIAATQSDPGNGGRMGRAEVTGIVQAAPYPILHVLESAQYPDGATILLMGQGKNGAQSRVNDLDGQVVRATGAQLNRGDLDGMILRGGANGVQAVDGSGTLPEPEDLGRWRLTGEICDGNCLAGAMRPGTGLAHRACANLCLAGGLPPVFVATDTVGDSAFFLVAGPDGGPMPDALLDFTALLVRAEGRVERHGSMNVFLVEPDSVELAR